MALAASGSYRENVELHDTLLMNNDPTLSWGAGPGAVTVTSGAELGGTGSICGPVTLPLGRKDFTGCGCCPDSGGDRVEADQKPGGRDASPISTTVPPFRRPRWP